MKRYPTLITTLTTCLASMSFACHDDTPAADEEMSGAQDSASSESADSSDSTESSGAEACYPAGPYGMDVGDTITNLEFLRDDGEPLDLGAFCGQAPPALVIFGSAAW